MEKSLLKRSIYFPALAFLRTFDFLVTKFTVDKPVLKEDELPFSQFLHDNRSVFLKEYNKCLLEKEMHSVTDFYKIGRESEQYDNWKGIPLVLFNCLFQENSLIFPETIALSKQLPGCCAVMFLVAGPGTHVPPHRGVYKGIYRCLFTLQLPPNADCWIRVAEQKIYFREGESIVFDETFEHEVMNASPVSRIVLSFDFYRKLPFPINLVNALIFFLLKNSFFLKNILKDYQKLENQTFAQFKSASAALP